MHTSHVIRNCDLAYRMRKHWPQNHGIGHIYLQVFGCTRARWTFAQTCKLQFGTNCFPTARNINPQTVIPFTFYSDNTTNNRKHVWVPCPSANNDACIHKLISLFTCCEQIRRFAFCITTQFQLQLICSNINVCLIFEFVCFAEFVKRHHPLLHRSALRKPYDCRGVDSVMFLFYCFLRFCDLLYM